MVLTAFTPTLEVPVTTVPWDASGSYLGRLWRWLWYTRKWKVTKDWYYRLWDETWIKIPKGFIMDGASIPKPFRFVMAPTGVMFIPGIIHDYSYQYGKLIGVEVTPVGTWWYVVTKEFEYHPGEGRAFWDSLFRRTGQQVSGLYILPNIMYFALVAAGSLAWNKWRKGRLKERLAGFCNPLRLWGKFGGGRRLMVVFRFYEVWIWRPLFKKKK